MVDSSTAPGPAGEGASDVWQAARSPDDSLAPERASGSTAVSPAAGDGGVSPGVLGALLAVALVPFVVLLVRAPFQDWFPVGDPAVVALRTREVFTGHTPLLGPYSHFGWAHPGPLLFYVLAVPYRLFGGHNGGLLVGALLVNIAAVVVVVVRLAHRTGAAVAFLGVAVLGAVGWSLGTSRLWSIWNPDITVLPVAALIVVVWTMRPTSRWDLPLVAILGSFVAQSHVGYVPLVMVLVAWAVAYRVWPANRRVATDAHTRHFELGVTAVIVALAWLPVALDAVLHRGGNARALVRFWLAGHDTLGMADALRIVAYELSLRGRLFGGSPPLFLGAVAPSGVPVPVTLFVLLAATVYAWRRRDAFALRACLLVVLLVVTATISVARVVGFVYPYLLNFLPVLAAMAWLAAGITVLRAVDAHSGATARRVVVWVTGAPAVAMAVVLVVSSAQAGIGSGGEDTASRNLSVLMPEVRAALGSRAGPLELTSSGDFSAGSFHAGVLLDLLEHGYAVTAGEADRLRYGDHYVDVPADARKLLVTSGSAEFRAARAARSPLATTGPARVFPEGAPPIRDGEDAGQYLLRVHPLVDAATYRALTRYLTSPYPVAVFDASAPTP
jgi:hypothetical protein